MSNRKNPATAAPTNSVNWMVRLGIITPDVLAARATNLIRRTAVVAATITNQAHTVDAARARATRRLLLTAVGLTNSAVVTAPASTDADTVQATSTFATGRHFRCEVIF
jgi:hypothetical protein